MVNVKRKTGAVTVPRGRRPMTSRVLTDALREVRKTRSRFLSILVLAALAVAFLAGLRSTAPDMKRSADAYFDQLDLMDVQVISTLGLTDEDLAVLSDQPGVRAAEGAWTADAVAKTGVQDTVVKLHSLSAQGINRPRLVAGRMPEAPDECLAEPDFLSLTGLKLGDTVTLDTGTDKYEDALAQSTFTIVGTADSPLYISVERGTSTMGTGKVSAFLLLPREAFAMETYTEVYMTLQGAEQLLCYSEGYENLADGVMDALEPLGKDRAALRFGSVVGDAQAELDDAGAELHKAEADADQKLSDAWTELTDARRKLDDGWAEYYDGQATLRRETADGKLKLADAYKDLTEGEADYAQGVQDLADGWTKYCDGLAELEDGRSKYREALAELEDGEAEYNDALVKLQDGEAEYADGLKAYQDGLAELEKAGKELTDAKKKLEDAADSLFAGGQQLSGGQAQYNDQVSQLNLLLSPVLAFAGYTGTTNDQLVDRMNDPAQQDTDWAVIDGTRNSLIAAVNAGVATPEQAALYYGLETAFPSAYGEDGYKATAAQLDAARRELASGQSSLSWGWAVYEDGVAQYQKGVKELEEGALKLQDAYNELTDARTELDDGWVELRKGRGELDDGWDQLDAARR